MHVDVDSKFQCVLQLGLDSTITPMLCNYSSGHKKVYVLDYAVAVVRYNRKRNVHTVAIGVLCNSRV